MNNAGETAKPKIIPEPSGWPNNEALPQAVVKQGE